MINKTYIFIDLFLGIGDWGLVIGQSPIPNPQSPLFCFELTLLIYFY